MPLVLYTRKKDAETKKEGYRYRILAVCPDTACLTPISLWAGIRKAIERVNANAVAT